MDFIGNFIVYWKLKAKRGRPALTDIGRYGMVRLTAKTAIDARKIFDGWATGRVITRVVFVGP